MSLTISTTLLKLSVDALQGKSPGFKVRCMSPACPLQCTLTFKTPGGFSSVSEETIAAAFSSLCGKLAKVGRSHPSIVSQKSLL